ncbi:MAG: MMPL family transporter [Planctomycetes bacterium]|nr:MMPL family transporter [Planctomycetota bacterium]
MPRPALSTLPIRRPRTLVALALLLAVAGGLVYATRLEIQSGRRQLSAPDRPLNQRAERFRAEFGVEEELLLCVAAAPPAELADTSAGAAPSDPVTRVQMQDVAARWVERLRARPDWFPKLPRPGGIDGGPYALLYLPGGAFDDFAGALDALLPSVAELARAPTLAHSFELLRGALRDAAEPADEAAAQRAAAGLEALTAGVVWLRDELARPVEAPVDRAALADHLAAAVPLDGYDPRTGAVFVGGERLLLLPVAVRGTAGVPNEYGDALGFARAALDAALADVSAAAPSAAPLQAGFAGMPALEAEEVTTSQADFGRGAVIALVLVSLLFAAAFGSWLRPSLAAVCLGIAVGATFLFAWLAVGHLNLVAMVFAIVLVALGVDFAIHFATHYERLLHAGHAPATAIPRTLRRVGRAIATGGLTTAAAFGAAAVTEAPGLSELGLIAGGGLVLCLATMLLVYPALLLGIDRGARRRGLRPLAPVGDLPRTPRGLRLAAIAAVPALAAAGFVAGQYGFDTNLLRLQPTDGAAAQWQGALVELEDRTQFAIATFADRAALESAQQRFEAHPELIASTDGPFPRDEAARRARLLPIGERLAALRVAPPAASGDPRQLRRALFGVRAELRRLAAADPRADTALAPLAGAVDALFAATAELDGERLLRVETELGAALGDALGGLAALCRPPAPIDPQRIPAPLRERHVAADGTLALYVHPAFDTWDGPARERFVQAALAVEPGLFGGVVNLDDNSAVMVRSFREASLIALAAVMLLTFLGVRCPRRTLLALLPLVTSLGLLLLLMRYGPAAVPWNFANFFALSILIGIGVDSGIHLVEAWGQGAVAYRSARRAVIVSMLTTLIGFGVLAASAHLGVRSLGIVLTLGSALVLATSLTLLPAALAIALPVARRSGPT